METSAPTERVRRKTTINLHDKRVVTAVSTAVSRTRGADVQPKDCRNDAKTIVSAYVLGQDAQTAAQRLLTWWCIDCGMKTLLIAQGHANSATQESIDRVMASANAGYAALEAIEKYGDTWLDQKPSNKPVVVGFPK